MPRAVFLGSDTFSLPILRALTADGPMLDPAVRVVGVVTQPDRPAGRGRRARANVVTQFAREQGLALLQPERIRSAEAVESVLALEPELLVVASFGQIIPRALLDTPRFGCLNLHPSLLPRFRGAAPIQAPILAGDTVTGASLMVVTPRMDAGPLLAQEEVPLARRATAIDLEQVLAEISAELLLRRLPAYLKGLLVAVPQDDAEATYTSKLSRDDALLQWQEPADMLDRRVRALNPWPGTLTYWNGVPLRVLATVPLPGEGEPGRVVGLVDGKLVIGTGDGLLGVERAQLPGGRSLAARDLVNGRPELLQARFSAAGS